jgi:hypothetical protein
MAPKSPPSPTPTPPPKTSPPSSVPPRSKPQEGPVRTQMVGEHGDEDIGYDPARIPVEDIPED